ncbi:sensor histidine kinase [Streptomyces sp. NPDC098789]|uniref:sensor histidine kinase n=1 Tax=Streptomyces sp. NPDC098789 TaxID=3366098 RepID=UPI0037F639D3
MSVVDTAVRPARRFRSPLAIDIGFSVLAFLDIAALDIQYLWPDLAVASAAAVALLVRRRWPVVVFALALNSVLFTENVLPALVCLFTLAELHRSRSALAMCGMSYAICANVPKVDGFAEVRTLAEFGVELGYSLVTAAAVAASGRLLQTRRALARHVDELHASEHERRELHARTVLAGERARLAREMHDVVSHQVSLIAVCAGALQVSADEPETREAARTIRTLSAATMDELRQMVALLRTPGAHDAELSPYSSQQHLDELIALSRLDARLVGDVPEDAGPAVRHAVYRTVQEALTNVRKHAPGSIVEIVLDLSGTGLVVTVTNTAARLPQLVPAALPVLPGSGLGLVGLRERAEALGGAFDHGAVVEGGYRLRARFPERTL